MVKVLLDVVHTDDAVITVLGPHQFLCLDEVGYTVVWKVGDRLVLHLQIIQTFRQAESRGWAEYLHSVQLVLSLPYFQSFLTATTSQETLDHLTMLFRNARHTRHLDRQYWH